MSNIAFVEVDAEDRARIEAQFPDAYISEKKANDDMDHIKDAEVLSCFIYSNITKDILDTLPNLKLICTRSVGYDHIDMHECAKRNITVCNVPDYGSHVIAEHVFALLLSATRHITEADARVESGNFDYHGLRGMALQDKTIGVIGTGKIGRNVCKIAYGFGMKILALDRCRVLELEKEYDVQYVSMEELLARSDVLTLHVPANDETQHMINDDTIAQMKDNVVLINTARGSLIDSAALLRGLDAGKFSHVLLDVMEHERDFAENKTLVEHDRVTSTPHIAFFADDSMQRMYADAFESITEFQGGQQPIHIVQPVEKVCDMPGVS